MSLFKSKTPNVENHQTTCCGEWVTDAASRLDCFTINSKDSKFRPIDAVEPLTKVLDYLRQAGLDNDIRFRDYCSWLLSAIKSLKSKAEIKSAGPKLGYSADECMNAFKIFEQLVIVKIERVGDSCVTNYYPKFSSDLWKILTQQNQQMEIIC